MEVHTHSHTESPSSGRAGKKFTHYLWEFLMLFLAVFCGFLAENLREHMVEKKRTKLYAQQFYEELKLDTSSLNHAINISGSLYKKYDTLFTILKAGISEEKKWKEFYYNSLDVDVWNTITFHNASFEQIKNSGSIRYFTNKQLVSAIQEYTSVKEYVESYQTGLVNYYDNHFTPFVEANFDKELLYYGTTPERNHFDSLWNNSSKPTMFLSGSKNAATEFKNMVMTIRDFYVGAITRQYIRLLNKSTDLLLILKKEYHLQ
jgi:hypothetical protein